MPEMDFTYATAVELADALRTSQISALELAQAAIARIESLDVDVNAVPVHDFDRAIQAAKEADGLLAAGVSSPLLGVPVTVKESFNVAGLPTTWGIAPFKDFIPDHDSLPVTRLRDAGAVILGKTNIPVALGDLQSYNPIYGSTSNPWNTDTTPGGSSGGSAAALAAGFGAVSVGSDIAGSLRVPAHFCGVFAHKPTFGLVPSRGHNPPAVPPLAYDRDLTVVGPMARSAADLELLLELLAAPDAPLSRAHRLALAPSRHEKLSDFRVLVVDSDPDIDTSSAVRSAIQEVAATLESSGATLSRSSDLLPDPTEANRIYMQLLMSSIAASLPPDAYADARAAAASVPETDTSLAAARARGAAASYRDWIAVDVARTRLRAQWATLFDDFDAVLCPASPTPAFAHDHSPDQWGRKITIDGSEFDYADQLVWAGIASAPGLPATVMPVQRTEDGLPVGVQLVGPMHEDRTTIRLAALLARHIGGFVRPPLFA
ncbi:MAG TPA: amidase [Galbitalea sp.]